LIISVRTKSPGWGGFFIGMALLSSFHGQSKADCLGDGDQRGQARVTVHGQGTLKTLAFDAGSFGDFGNALSLGKVAQGN
jgi:hypothetical protein